MQLFPTPRAAAAIIKQMESKSDRVHEIDGVTDVFGVEVDGSWAFAAHFTTDWRGPYSDYPGQPDYYTAWCSLIGAWAYDPNTDTITFAGNRDELVAAIGADEVNRWEEYAADKAMEAGPDDGGDEAYDFWKGAAA